jgi:opacity protein-like surface antigen
MPNHVRVRFWFALIALSAALVAASATDARAQGFISPLIGYDFGGDASCPQISNCQDKRMNYGVALGTMGPIFGFEEEFAYAKDFFGTTPALNSSVFTAMSNVMIVPRIGPVRPYLLGGLGLIKSHADFTAVSLLTSDNNSFGWDMGGGVIALASSHVGVRGDIRYFHAFQDATIAGFIIQNPKLDFGRASVALIVTF